MSDENRINFDGKSWEESRFLVGFEISRNSKNIHDLTNDIHGVGLTAGLAVKELAKEVEVDRENTRKSLLAHDLRMGMAEIKLGLFGMVGGSVGGFLMNVLWAWISKRL